jgi:ATP-dependent Clp protease adaptor protein ClpS
VATTPFAPTKPKPKHEEKVRLLPPYHVILLNDDDHSFDFVINVLRKVFGFELERAVQFTIEAHSKGRAIVWTGPKEVAEFRVEQVQTHHEVRDRDGAKLGPVDCIIEPAPT